MVIIINNSIFRGCKYKEVYIDNRDDVEFNDCGSLELDISNLDTSNVINMSNMIMWCKSLNSLDLSKWDVSTVRRMGVYI